MRYLILSLLILLITSRAHAQSPTTGAVHGRVTDKTTKEPLVGVTVIVTSTARDDQHSALTEVDGTYKITELLPGDYIVNFYADKAQVTRDNIHVGANETVPVFVAMMFSALEDIIEIHDPPPLIKLDRTDRGFKRTQEEIRKLPQPGRTADAVAGAAAGAQNDGVGTAFSGSTSLENRYLVDGIDITGLTYGDVGTAVLNDFIEEIEVLTGGYNAEWGRAIGGIVNVVTKTGTNKFQGSIFGHLTPGALSRASKTAPINASSIDITSNRAYSGDLGFEVGGPIVKNRLWFYAGFAPSFARTDYTRTTKRQVDCRQVMENGELSTCDTRLVGQGGFADGNPDRDPATGFYLTDRVDSEVRSATSRSYSILTKLNLAVSPRNQAQLTLIAVPSSGQSPGLLGLPTTASRSAGLTTDMAARWTSKFDDNKTELEATVAWHRSTLDTGALDSTYDSQPRQILQNGNLGTWSALGGESAKTAADCRDGGPGDPYQYITNCPMVTQSYALGGPGAIARDEEERRTVRLGAIHRARLLGGHELKAGFDYEDNRKLASRIYSGGAFLVNNVGAGQVQVTRWVQLAADADGDARFDEVCHTPDPDAIGIGGGGSKAFRCDYLSGTPGAPGTQIRGQTANWAAYLRDSWQPVSNLTLNLGLRYEEQKMLYASNLRGTLDPLTGNRIGEVAMDLAGNFAPRLGVIWDPTKVGRSKVFAAWGRFFEAIPMDINDRSFGGEVSYTQTYQTGGSMPPCGPTDPRLGGADGLGCLSPNGSAATENLLGSSGVLVAPGIAAQYMDEALAGVEYQLSSDLKVGLAYQNRRLGRVIEDVSTDGAQTYVIANPGEWSRTEQNRLEDRIAHTDDPATRRRLERELALYEGIRVFDKPARDYHAVELTVGHRATRGLFVQGSYTYSRTLGNYPGSVSYDNGQIDPNISSQYDLIELLANRQGALPQDRPHSIKIDSYYSFDVGKHQMLTIGARARAISGVPVSALGAHYLYGPD
ncbi:MAG: TonB-dependent receptor, partial [Deltaproteobacteria bacterium]|nr:TonB-dependent receptor [Deltaproteobacteria bacterium]